MLARYRFLRFLIAGGVNTLFGFSVYSALILAHVVPWLGLLLASVAGVLFNFMTTGAFVFRTKLQGRLLRFFAAYGVVYLINLALISVLRQWSSNEIVSQAILSLPMAVFSYLLLQRFVFTAPRKS